MKFQPKSQFNQKFSKYEIPLYSEDISNENIKPYKNWINSESVSDINKYRNFMIKDKKIVKRLLSLKGNYFQ